MSKQSFLSKNAYLSVYITENFIYAHLAYSHYDINRTYILTDVSPVPKNFEGTYEFWSDYFQKLEEKWGWDFLKKSNFQNDEMVRNIKDFENEGEGIAGCSIRILKKHPFYKVMVESLRRFCLDLKIIGVDNHTDSKLYRSFSSYMDYDDCIYLDLNVRNFEIYRFESKENDYKVTDVVYDWLSIKDLMKMVESKKYSAFTTKYLNANFRNNLWANFILKPVLKTDSEVLRDFVRAYITVQLLAIFNSRSEISKDFGTKKSSNLIWVTGELIQIPEFKKLLISVIDGLQLKGQFDFCLDTNNIMYTFGDSFVKGIDSDEMVFTKDTFLPHFAKVFIPEIELRPGDRQVLYNGRLRKVNEEMGLQINMMSSELTEIVVNSPYDMLLEGEFTKKAFLDEYEDFFDLNCFSYGISFNRIVFDGRFKPVVYGPGAKDNSLKFSVWLSSESYT